MFEYLEINLLISDPLETHQHEAKVISTSHTDRL